MRAAERSVVVLRDRHSTSVASQEAEGATALTVRLVLVCLAVVALLITWLPSVVHAQRGGAQRVATFTVQARGGETLHDLAFKFYGDSAQWQQVATANNLTRATGATIVPAGTSVRLPGKTAAEIASIVARTRPTTSLAAQTAGKGDAAAPPRTARTTAAPPAAAGRGRQAAATDTIRPRADSAAIAADTTPIQRPGVRLGIISLEDMRAARGRDEPTIFMSRPAESVSEIRAEVAALQAQQRTIAPRQAEFDAAPFAVEEATLSNAGAVVMRLNGSGTADRELPRNIRLADEIVVELPEGLTPTVGQKLVSVHKGPELDKGTFIVVPTGMLEVVRVESGQVVARLVRQSGIVDEGQRLLVASGSAMAPQSRPVPVSSDPVRGAVSFILGDQLLPSLQTYLVVNAGEAEGVRAGDEFWLVERIGVGADAREHRIAVVRIVRTSPGSSTGIVTHQDRAGIAVGVEARRVARMEASGESGMP